MKKSMKKFLVLSYNVISVMLSKSRKIFAKGNMKKKNLDKKNEKENFCSGDLKEIVLFVKKPSIFTVKEYFASEYLKMKEVSFMGLLIYKTVQSTHLMSSNKPS